MRDVREWTSNAAAAAPKLEYQVAAAIAAVTFAAIICKAPLEPAQSPAAPIQLAESKAAEKLPAVENTDERFRPRAASVLEFAAVYGLATDKPYTALAAAEWSSRKAATRTIDEAVAKPQRKATVVAQLCADGCSLPPASAAAALVPPPRPAGLTAQAAATSEDEPVRLLGLSLPGFVPSRETIAKTVVSWSGSIAGVIPGL
ncbi:MAG TPA: hypothetical protein VFY72_01995 [Beijerinckiaceae bacterium]|nr:hypothetical protein [Beijerinckiaceae bacterium]